MTKKIVDIAIMLAGIAFLCWYLSVAYYNVYACDDYWFGSNVRENGFWGNQLFYYLNWEGSYTHTFLASLPHVFHGSRIPFFVNAFTLILLFLSLFSFLKVYTNISVKRGLVNTLYLLAFLYLCTKGNSEIRFWVCANITYISEMSILLIFWTLYHTLKKDSSYLKWILVLLCLFLIGGSKLTCILYAVSGIVMHDILYRRSDIKVTLWVCLVLAAFLIVNISAPGNYIRLEEETLPKDEHITLVGAVFYRIAEMEPFLLNTLFLLPISTQWLNTHAFEKRRVRMAMMVLALTFIIDSIIMYICFNDPGPLRIYFISEVVLMLLVMFGLNHFYTSVLSRYYYSGPVMVVLALLVVVSHLCMTSQVSDSIAFSVEARARDQYVMSCSDDDIIEISPLPSSYLMLSYYSNDSVWLERIYLPYFQKRNKFILLNSQGDVN